MMLSMTSMRTFKGQKRLRDLHSQQGGIASLLFAMVMMVVISLIVLGFAQVARRGQRESTDSQLSASAYYAAESGVNDVINLAAQHGGTLQPKTTCANTGTFYSPLQRSSQLSAADNVSYTCVLVNTGAGGGIPSLAYSSLSTGQSWATEITPGDSYTGNYYLRFELAPNGGGNTLAQCPSALGINPASWSCPYPVLRFDLVPQSTSGYTRSSLDNSTMTAFISPTSSSATGSAAFQSANGGKALEAQAACSDSDCTFDVTGLHGKYYIRVLPLYVQAKQLTLTAYSSANTPVGLSGSQVIVDVTGKAQDVLRRIQVHLPVVSVNRQGIYPDYALESTDSICKRFSYQAGNNPQIYIDGNIDPSISAGAAADDNPLCDAGSNPPNTGLTPIP